MAPPCGGWASESFWKFKAPLRSSLEDIEMKHLFRALFCLALFCGVVSHAGAQNFHVQVLDPPPMNNCSSMPSLCTIAIPNQTFDVTFGADSCGQVPIGDIPTDGTPFGCLVIINGTLDTFTSLSMTLSGPSSTDFECPTDVAGSIFSNSDCHQVAGDDSTYSLLFSGTPGLGSTDTMIVFETGLQPTSLSGDASVTATPEPDSILLMATGTMMAGLYLSRKQLAAAFNRAK